MSQTAVHNELAEQESAILDYLDGLLAEDEGAGAHLRLVHPPADDDLPVVDEQSDLPGEPIEAAMPVDEDPEEGEVSAEMSGEEAVTEPQDAAQLDEICVEEEAHAAVTATGEAVDVEDSCEELPEGMLFGEEFAEPEAAPEQALDASEEELAEEVTPPAESAPVEESVDAAAQAQDLEEDEPVAEEPAESTAVMPDEELVAAQGEPSSAEPADDCPVTDDAEGQAYLVGRSGPLWIALPVDRVETVLAADELPAPVRGAPPQVAGAVAWQGRRVPVLDLGTVMRDAPATSEGRVALLGGGRWGVRLDSAPVERRLTPERFQWTGSGATRSRAWLAGVARDERLVVLDIEGLRQSLRG